MNNLKLKEEIRKSLPRQDINKPIIFINDKTIIVGQKEYKLKTYSNGSVELFQRVIINNRIYHKKVNNKSSLSLKNRTLKTKKVQAKMSQKVKLGLIAIALILASNKIKKTYFPPVENPVIEETIDSTNEVEPLKEIALDQSPAEQIEVVEPLEVIQEDMVTDEEPIMISKHENASVDLTSLKYPNTNPSLKRQTVLERFPYIPEYLKQVGISPELGLCIVSQESGDESHSYQDQYQNIWQLTNSIIDEKMEVPVFNNNEVSIRKIYVYSNARPKSVSEASKLKNEGYSIYDIKDVKNNPELNTLIGTTYLAHCINKTGGLFSGMVGYNAGYPSAKGYSNAELISGAVRNSDPNYIKNCLQYASNNEIAITWPLYRNKDVTFNQTTIHINGLIKTLEASYEEAKHHLWR